MKVLITVIIIIIISAITAFISLKFFNTDYSNVVAFEQCVEAGNPVMESFPEQCRTQDGVLFVNWRGAGQFCVQVITSAKNPRTSEVREFPTPCDVPAGWELAQ